MGRGCFKAGEEEVLNDEAQCSCPELVPQYFSKAGPQLMGALA
jgi:hypothetical protein